MGFYIRVTTRPAPKPEYTFLTNNKHFLNTVSTQTTISNALLYIPMTTTRKKDTQKSLYYSILIQTWFMLVPGSKLPEFSRLLLEKKSEVKGWHWVIFVRDTLGYLFLTGCFNISSTSPQLIAHKCWGKKAAAYIYCFISCTILFRRVCTFAHAHWASRAFFTWVSGPSLLFISATRFSLLFHPDRTWSCWRLTADMVRRLTICSYYFSTTANFICSIYKNLTIKKKGSFFIPPSRLLFSLAQGHPAATNTRWSLEIVTWIILLHSFVEILHVF